VCKQIVNYLLHVLNYNSKYFDKENFFLLLRPMKIVPSKIVLLFVGLLFSNFIFAAPNPPSPSPPPPPGLPVNEGLVLLVIASVILGFYKIYTTKKASS